MGLNLNQDTIFGSLPFIEARRTALARFEADGGENHEDVIITVLVTSADGKKSGAGCAFFDLANHVVNLVKVKREGAEPFEIDIKVTGSPRFQEFLAESGITLGGDEALYDDQGFDVALEESYDPDNYGHAFTIQDRPKIGERTDHDDDDDEDGQD